MQFPDDARRATDGFRIYLDPKVVGSILRREDRRVFVFVKFEIHDRNEIRNQSGSQDQIITLSNLG